MQTSREKNRELLFKAGMLLVLFSLLLFFLIFYPVISVELRYLLSAKKQNGVISLDNEKGRASGDSIIPVSSEFSLIIPKLKINSKVISDVDPYSSKEYELALKEGIAHARGTGLPGGGKNIFLFAHSSGNFYETSRTNTIFFLLNKLEQGDNLFIVHKNRIFNYQVQEKKVVAGDAVEYLTKKGDEETLTLMTCWPPGTDYERLIIVAEKFLN